MSDDPELDSWWQDLTRACHQDSLKFDELDSLPVEPFSKERIDGIITYVLERDAREHPDDPVIQERLRKHLERIHPHDPS